MLQLHERPIGGKTNPTVAAESDKTATPTTLCDQCSKPFEPRSGSGGKPQRFCSTACRTAFHGAEPQRAQHSPTCSNVAQLSAVVPPKKEDAPAGAAEDFNWNDTESVILPEQPATACYWNPKGELVIRQKGWPDDDSFIYIAPNLVSEFIDKLTDLIGIPSVGGPER
jgi:hypothetical protein